MSQHKGSVVILVPQEQQEVPTVGSNNKTPLRGSQGLLRQTSSKGASEGQKKTWRQRTRPAQ